MNNFKSRVLEPAITQINEKPTLKLKSNSIKQDVLLQDFHSSLSKTNGNF